MKGEHKNFQGESPNLPHRSGTNPRVVAFALLLQVVCYAASPWLVLSFGSTLDEREAISTYGGICGLGFFALWSSMNLQSFRVVACAFVLAGSFSVVDVWNDRRLGACCQVASTFDSKFGLMTFHLVELLLVAGLARMARILFVAAREHLK